MNRLLLGALGAAVALGTSVAQAEGLPPPPAPETHGRLVPGQTVQLERTGGLSPELRVVPLEGAIYLEQPAWTWLLDARRHADARAEAAMRVAARERWRGLAVGVGAGLSAGSAVFATTGEARPALRWAAAAGALATAVLTIVLVR